MGYHAIAAGNWDIASSFHKSDKEKQERLPLISANIVDPKGNNPFSPFTTVTAGSYKIGIVAITEPTKGNHRYKAVSWQKGLKAVLPEMRKNCDFVVLLSNLSTKENRTIAQNYPDVNVIISADENITNLSASLIGSTLITQTATRGQYIGVLDLELTSVKKWKKGYYTINSLKRKQHSISKTIGKLRSERPSAGNSDKISQLMKQYQDIPEKIKQAEDNLKQQKGSSFSVEFVSIDKTLKNDPVIEKILR